MSAPDPRSLDIGDLFADVLLAAPEKVQGSWTLDHNPVGSTRLLGGQPGDAVSGAVLLERFLVALDALGLKPATQMTALKVTSDLQSASGHDRLAARARLLSKLAGAGASMEVKDQILGSPSGA